MNNISFTGIQNLYVGKRNYSKYGSYLSLDGNVKQGNKDFTEVLIKCKLTDDKYGNHLSEFNEVLSKSRPCYHVNCINKKAPDEIKLLMKHFNVQDDPIDVNNSEFFINDYQIMLDEKQVLPLFSFMAKITRLITNAKGPTENQKQYAKFVNNAVHNEAMNYIENVM